jgi:adenylylsulfate kinase-like enzyme
MIAGAGRGRRVHRGLRRCAALGGRSARGLYRKARAGEIKHFTGISSPYEPPLTPDLRLDTTIADANELADRVVGYLQRDGYAR